VEKFDWNFFASPYSEPEGMVLSSAAMVTATETVQADEKTSTTKGITKDFIRLSFPSFDFAPQIAPLAYRLRFGRMAGGDLYLRFALTLSKESGASYFAQAYIPT
jgi:hypothetical protein